MLPMTAATFIFAWEFGSGLGHAARIKPLAQELLRRGHRVRLILRDLAGVAELLKEPSCLPRATAAPKPTRIGLSAAAHASLLT